MRRLLFIVSLASMTIACLGKPAYRGPIIRTAADGTEQTIYLHGDEHFHYMTNAAGQWLDEESLVPLTAEQKNSRMEMGLARKARRIAQQQTANNAPNIAPRGLLILVNFADQAFVTPRDTINNMLNGEHFTRNYSFTYNKRQYTISSSGSARKYFYDQSYGQYNPTFDVIGPVTLSNNISYYGENDRWGNDKRPTDMIKEACQLADEQYGIDFTQYDNDNDGYVDFVYVIYAGNGEADGGDENTVWPHQWNLTYANIRLSIDGKQIDRYACGNEINYASKVYDGIGTFCHEFSHVLGLPDLYPTDDGTHHTLYEWDLLDYGTYNNEGNTPPAYSAYERFFMGWLKPRVLTKPEYVWLNPLNFQNGEALLLCEGDEHNLVGHNPKPTDFYLVECRTQTGWDKYLPGKGLLITHIRYSSNTWDYNTVNNDPNAMGVDLIEAKTNNASYGRASDAFPAGATYWRSFADHEVTDIKIEPNGAVTFCYRGADRTGVENIQTDHTQGIKIIENGQIVIIRNGKRYNALGIQIQ